MWRRGEKGASAVEFALVLPPLLLVLFGITDIGIILYRQQVITYVSRDAARFAVAWPQPSETVVENRIISQLNGSPLFTGVSASNVDYSISGNDLTVTIHYPLTFLVLSNFVPGLASGQTQTAQTTMKLE